jgi:hypothetical protein
VSDFDEDKWVATIDELAKIDVPREKCAKFVKDDYSLSIQGEKFASKIKEIIK